MRSPFEHFLQFQVQSKSWSVNDPWILLESKDDKPVLKRPTQPNYRYYYFAFTIMCKRNYSGEVAAVIKGDIRGGCAIRTK